MKLTKGKYASYLKIKEFTEESRPLKTVELADDVYADYDKDGNLIGIELVGNVEIDYYSDYKED